MNNMSFRVQYVSVYNDNLTNMLVIKHHVSQEKTNNSFLLVQTSNCVSHMYFAPHIKQQGTRGALSN